jgi:hypothetical protein
MKSDVSTLRNVCRRGPDPRPWTETPSVILIAPVERIVSVTVRSTHNYAVEPQSFQLFGLPEDPWCGWCSDGGPPLRTILERRECCPRSAC